MRIVEIIEQLEKGFAKPKKPGSLSISTPKDPLVAKQEAKQKKQALKMMGVEKSFDDWMVDMMKGGPGSGPKSEQTNTIDYSKFNKPKRREVIDSFRQAQKEVLKQKAERAKQAFGIKE